MADLLRRLKRDQIQTESYEVPAILDHQFFGVIQIKKDFDLRTTMVYTSGMPPIVTASLLLKADTYPLIGAVSPNGKKPGRDPTGKHILNGPFELTRDIRGLARKGVNQKRDILANPYVFALTDIQVVQWTEEALKLAHRV